MKEWETRFPKKESVDERKGTKAIEHEKPQSNTERQPEGKEASQTPPKPSLISPDASLLKPTPAPPHKPEYGEAAHQPQRKQVNFNEFENGLAPPDPWDPPVTIKEELQELKGEALELVPKTIKKDNSGISIEDDEQPNLDTSMESVGIEAAKLASLHFANAPTETITAFYEVYKESMELSCITDEDRVRAFKDYPRHSLEYLRHLARFADLGFTSDEVAKALLATTAINNDGSINKQIDDETVLAHLMR